MCVCVCVCVYIYVRVYILSINHAHRSQLPSHLPNDAAKRLLCGLIDTYIDERIVLADRAISVAAAAKVRRRQKKIAENTKNNAEDTQK